MYVGCQSSGFVSSNYIMAVHQCIFNLKLIRPQRKKNISVNKWNCLHAFCYTIRQQTHDGYSIYYVLLNIGNWS